MKLRNGVRWNSLVERWQGEGGKGWLLTDGPLAGAHMSSVEPSQSQHKVQKQRRLTPELVLSLTFPTTFLLDSNWED